MSRASGLSPADKNRLGWACKPIRDAFDTYPYLVGSALDSSDYRDIDIRLILDDDDFRRMFGGRGDGMARLRLVNTALSALVQQASGLPKPIDFQIQPQSYANDEHSKPRNPLGMSGNRGGFDAPDWSASPTPTGPESVTEERADFIGGATDAAGGQRVNPGWWVIAGDVFLEALKRAAAGESPDLLYAEYYANTERVDPNEGETK